MKITSYWIKHLQAFRISSILLGFTKMHKLLTLLLFVVFTGFQESNTVLKQEEEIKSTVVIDDKQEIKNLLSSAGSNPTLALTRPNVQTFVQVLASLQNNDPHVYTIDLTQEQLNQEKVQQLKEAIDNNAIIGYIQWGQIPPDCEQIKEQIETKLISNICNYTYYPSDYVHGLLANHVYSNPKLDQQVDLTVLSKELGHQLPGSVDTTWKVVQVKDDSQHTGYYSVLYINENTNQAILSFQGTKVEGLKDLARKNSDLKEDIDGVLGNAITEQNALGYVATKEAVDYAKEKEYNLSITGHSLGAYLAELAVAYCYRDFSYRQVKGIVFDSPGTVNKLDKFKSNVINKATKFSIANLPIVTYLSAPNLINTCNGHPGEVYRVYPQLMWSEQIKTWIKRAKKVPLLGSKVKSMDKGLLAVTGHSLTTILQLFDPVTGKPSTYMRIADWPKIDTDKVAYIGKKKQEFEKGDFFKKGLSLLTGGPTNLIGGAFDMLPTLVGGTAASVWGVLKDLMNINQTQYWTTLAYLDGDYKEIKLNSQKEFNLRYEGHYRVSDKTMSEHILYTENYEGIDWYLYELYQYKDKLEQSPTKDVTFAVLKNILKDYDVVSLDEHPYIRLVEKQNHVEALRDKMQRSIKVLSSGNIKKAFEDSNIYALTKQLEKRSIQQFTQLHTYIAQAKLTTYLLRENKEEELSQKLKKEGVCVVSGHGGVGKSTLVAQYGYSQKEDQLVWWMQAETQEKLVKSYQELAQELGIDYQKLAEGFKQAYEQYLLELSRRVYNALADRKRTVLLILDNAADSKLIANVLKHRPSSVQIVITTRKARNFEAYSQVKLAAFKKEEGIKYVKKWFESSLYQPTDTEITALIEEVGLIPQNLALAVGYIGQKKLMTMQGYVAKLREIKKTEIKDDKKFILPEVSLGLEGLDLQSQLTMRYGAYLDPDFISLSLISALVGAKDEEILESLLDRLEELSLITIIKGQGNELGIQIHREVQAACKQYQGWINKDSMSDEELVLSIIKVLDENMPWVTEVPDSTWDQARIYAPNVVYVIGNVDKTLKTSLLADLISRLGNYKQQVERNFEQALKYNRQALEMRQALYPGNHIQVAESFNNLGRIYKALGNYQEALKYFERALEIRQELYPGNHTEVAESLHSLGRVYRGLGEYQKALEYSKQALEMWQALYPGNHPQVADAFNTVGSAYKALGQYQEALKCYQQALEIRQALYTGNHPDLAQSMNSLGVIHRALGHNQEALKYLKQALEIRKALYTDNHPKVAQSYNNVGSVYKIIGRYQEALEYYKQALEMKKGLYKGNHPSIASSLNSLGDIYIILGQPEEALKCYQEALAMRKTLYARNHPEIANSLCHLGDFYQSLGQYQEALKYYQEALAMRKMLYTGNHPDIAVSLNSMGNVYQALNKHQDALKYYKEALAMREAVYQDDHPDIAITLNNLGTVYKALGEYQEALKYYQQALVMRRALYRCNHPDILISLNNIADVYKALGQPQEALKYSDQALTMKQALDIDHTSC
ncbi:MAG: hypothetical protein BGO68_04705 [Candidatus Amoebophilus sp. 36-38]|nr:MAG: hypothetical protein BGO68_04705 [Candidatus Amoebophilus sp. 36-38]